MWLQVVSADDIRGVLLERDQLLREKEQLNQFIDQLLQTKDKLLEENSQLKQENSQLNRENSQLNQHKDQLIQEKDKLLEENSQLNQDKNQLLQEKNKLLEENSRLNQVLPNLPRCSPGWKRLRSSCYRLSSIKSTWEDAKQNCESLGAHLVIISDDAEKDFVRSYGQAEHFWIGFKYEWNYMSSMWTSKWVDGSQLCYNNFGQTSSSSTPWSCAYQSATWSIWDTAECNKNYYWMCEKELNF
ncbi:C-type lectin domain family 4 member G-like isoform X2 [Simochromis diagramma]|uniref:C-type lectin domain family 4 member G-like isoform X2 n=1 Tax=Simochromis diagramma TaxID=43689 RepID=UPI001A7E1CD1|nr:C-type lectin domain family 4 member G-like isoform X2 [Simochromis diagramma]